MFIEPPGLAPFTTFLLGFTPSWAVVLKSVS